MHNNNNGNCEVSFPNENEFAKALEYLLHKSKEGYTGVGENTVIISQKQCNGLDKIKGLQYKHNK
jgi:hypothetical protein